MEFTAPAPAPAPAPATEETQEERIAWLRDRGVEINIPGESVSKKLASAGHSVLVVKIPCDYSEPYAEVSVTVDENAAGDQLITVLKPRFATADTIKDSALKKAAEGLLHSSDAVATLAASRDRLSDMLMGEGHVEAFSLTRPAASNGWAGVVAYLDEAGQLKGLPVNQRASALAGFCGFDSIQLLGDIYVGRITRAGGASKPHNVDFTIAEVDSSCAWIKNAHRDNYQQGLSAGRVAMPDAGGTLIGTEIESSDPGKPYKWTQTEETVDVTLSTKSFSDGVISKKDLSVNIKSSHLKITHKTFGTLLDIEFKAAIKPSDSTWSLSGNDIEVSMEKVIEAVWSELEKSK